MRNTKTEIQYLEEAGVTVDHGYYAFLDEATKVKVTDNVMVDMFKFITDKYNSIDFSEIEKSAGDYKRFKYADLIDTNIETLRNVYLSSSEPGAQKFIVTLNNMQMIVEFLKMNREKISYLYKNKDGIAQLIYTSLTSSLIYGVSTLVAQTIRFITLEDDTEVSVVYDEMNNAAKNIHIKNISTAANSIKSINQYIDTAYNNRRNKVANESITLASITASGLGPAAIAFGAAILILPRIIPMIREIIYAIYYSRVNIAQALDVQISLVNTNIESLEQSGRGNKKIIAKQRNIVKKLQKLQNIVAVKTDDAKSLTSRKINEENRTLHIDRESELAGTEQMGLMI